MDKLVARSLTGKEVTKLVKGKANIMTYRELQKYDNINDAMGPYEALILLYESKIHYGHWTLVFRAKDGTIEHFDSYGYMPDQELLQVPKNFKKRYYNKIPHLTYLLYKSMEPVRFSQYKLQSRGPRINTCGRWVAMRLLLRDLSEDQFHDLMTSTRSINPDELVTVATENLL